ncbi:MAG: DUF3426 domain-containing protein [Deltaproteobacteria bacterium]|nr:DUF3426 domain-containing protein [Deltaproteobacteria bacterium]
MIVACPVCQTRYRFDGSGLVDETTRFECTQDGCGQVFQYSPPLLAGAKPPPPFSPPKPPPVSPPRSVPDDTLTIPADEGAFSDEETFAEDFLFTKPLDPLEEESFDREDFVESEAPFSSDTPFYNDTDAAERDQTEALFPQPRSTAEATLSPGKFLIGLGGLLLLNGLLGVYCFLYPASTEAWLARIPVLGYLVASEQFPSELIELTNLEGRYQTTKDGQRVFAVSGVATNTAGSPARTIQIEGEIYDAQGKALGERLIFCGPEITPDRLTNLRLREIGALQDLMPPKQFQVPAGSSVKFLIVFTAPPSTVAQFRSRVVAAQFDNS